MGKLRVTGKRHSLKKWENIDGSSRGEIFPTQPIHRNRLGAKIILGAKIADRRETGREIDIE